MMVSSCTVKLAKQNYFSSIQKNQIIPLIIRGCAGTIAFVTITLSVARVPLSIFQVVQNCLPFLAGLLAFVFLGERISLFEFFAMCMCFCGIGIVGFNG